MSKINVVIIIAVVIGIFVVGGYFLLLQIINQSTNQTLSSQKNNQTQNQNQQQNSQIENNDQQSNATDKIAYEIIYTDNGYSPSPLTIKTGDTVVFKNQSSNSVWTASAMHPSHTVYSETSLEEHCPDASNSAFDECKSSQPSESWSFTFNKKGAWNYHNHLKPFHFGKIIVE